LRNMSSSLAAKKLDVVGAVSSSIGRSTACKWLLCGFWWGWVCVLSP
jgi:hypothetical protein